MTARTIRWRALDGPGWEHLDLTEGTGGVTARSTLIGEREGTRYGLFYEAHLAPDWTFRSIAIRTTDGRTFGLHSDGVGAWADAAGEALPGLAGCIDIDLSGSPFTNSLPVRRTALPMGQPQTFTMAWIPLDTLRPFRDRQTYTRLGARRFRYQSADGSFEADIDFDEDGLVVRYPGLFEAIPPQGQQTISAEGG